MPKGGMKKYISFVIGLLIIFTVIDPFINISKVKFDLDKEVIKNLEGTISVYKDESILMEQERQIEELYKGKIRDEIDVIVSKNTKYNIFYTDILLEKSDQGFGVIRGINIVLQDEENKLKENNINVKVKPVAFQEQRLKEENNNYLFHELKTLIANRLDIELEVISISMNEQGG